jgi:hypothetical protein
MSERSAGLCLVKDFFLSFVLLFRFLYVLIKIIKR